MAGIAQSTIANSHVCNNNNCVEKLIFVPPKKFHELKVSKQIARDCLM